MLATFSVAVSRRTLILIAGALALCAIAVTTGLLFVRAYARDYAVAALKTQFASDVSMGSLELSVFPSVRATGTDLTLKFGGRSDLPPLIAIQRFTVSGSFAGLLRYPRHVGRVELTGLQIHVPPPDQRSGAKNPRKIALVVDEVVADGAVLEIMPQDPKKDALKFEMRRLTLTSASTNNPVTFHAELINATPPGLIHSDGKFGPWAAEAPGDTPVSGQYTFRNANLGVFKGIKGTLASDGRYDGQLARIEVQGTTDVPDFALTQVEHPMHLRATFAATVDGTNGDTDLHPVKAVLGKSAFEVSGTVERGAVAHGKEIDLSAKAANASLQDFLRLAVKGDPPPMTGAFSFNSKIKIPPGNTTVIAKLDLDGQFHASGVKFTDAGVQEKIAGLSHRAQGDPKDHDPDVTASLAGKFLLHNATMDLPRLAFELPGAHVDLDGHYGLATGMVDFKGTARLDATVSQMTTGIKSVLLKPVDRLFRHDGAGTLLPIAVSGTRDSPSFRLDIGQLTREK